MSASRRSVCSLLDRRAAESPEVAALVCFVASDRASFITGAACMIDGGTMAWRVSVSKTF